MPLSLPPLLPGGLPLLGHLRAFYRDRTARLRRGYATCGSAPDVLIHGENALICQRFRNADNTSATPPGCGMWGYDLFEANMPSEKMRWIAAYGVRNVRS
jgi:hypothetical protein